ncbi:uncharacterized protein DUF1579 [Dokdonella fugitiva]|uniref:Uncharacterized protein DUF1579 n=2 Tax=Dokdonella fugitiva TaxID=328517 RepID=A0A4R2IL06_9GAMM|nr:uncharacterized protein DUF1579 [Dokdonella fugitiva]
MDMPGPGPDHGRLARFVGAWSGEERLSPSPWGPGGCASGRFEFRVGVDGMALLQDYEEEKDGRVAFRGHGVFIVDPLTQGIAWWWFDSLGFAPEPPARGRWDGDILRMEKHTPRGAARYTFALGDDAFVFRIENRFAGQDDYVEFMRGDYRRLR